VVIAIMGVLFLLVSLAAAGWIQGHDLNDTKISFAAIADHTRPWLLGVSAAQTLLLVGNILLLVNFFSSVCCLCCSTTENSFRQPSTMEAHAS
jgi:hypothetical protein